MPLLSLSIMFSRSIHIVACQYSPPFYGIIIVQCAGLGAHSFIPKPHGLLPEPEILPLTALCHHQSVLPAAAARGHERAPESDSCPLPTALQDSHLPGGKHRGVALPDVPHPLPALSSFLSPSPSLCSRHRASMLFLQHSRHGPAPGPLLILFSPAGMPFLWTTTSLCPRS